MCIRDRGEGKRVHVIANNEEQAAICLDTARTMIRRQKRTEVSVLWDRIEHKDADCIMTALPALPRALDGLNPSMWIADEMAEFKGRHLTKLLSAMGKRREVLGVIISTPSSNPENHYSEMVSTAIDSAGRDRGRFNLRRALRTRPRRRA